MNTYLNIEDVVKKNPSFWNENRRKILGLIDKHTTEHDFSGNNLMNVENEFRENNSKYTRQHKKQLAAVLEELNVTGFLNAVIPAIPVRIPQPSILPANISLYSYLDSASELYLFVKNKWLNKQRTNDELLFAFAITLSFEAGISCQTLINSLTTLKNKDIHNNYLALPIHLDDKTSRRHLLSAPLDFKKILKLYLRGKDTIDPERLFILPDIIGYKKRKKSLIQILRKTYSTISSTNNATLPTLTEFLSLGPLIAFHKGMEPFLITTLKGSVLPTSHPYDSPFSLVKSSTSPPSGLIAIRKPIKEEKLPVNLNTSISNNIHDDKTDYNEIDDWCGKSKLVLRCMIRELEDNWDTHLPAGQIVEAKKIFSLARGKADIHTIKKSALHLAIDWAEYKFVDKRTVTPSTVRTYLERTFLTSFLTDSDSIDLAEWESEDHEYLLEAALSREKLQNNTRKDIISTFKQVYKFASDRGYCPNVNIKFIADEWVGGTNRYEILGLSEFDSFLRLLHQRGTRDSLIFTVISILGFYGGLRAADVTRLTINDIIIDHDYLAIEIHKGKTPAARRRILLSSLAPDDICTIVSDFIIQRKNEFRKDAVIKSISLFGPPGIRKRYCGRKLINQVITHLKHSFGQNFVFHSLRHCFASWTIVRWYALRHPSLIKTLSEAHHKVFTVSSQKKLAQLFTLGIYDTIPDHISHDIVTITKLIGHGSPGIFFNTYVHTMHLLHNHATIKKM